MKVRLNRSVALALTTAALCAVFAPQFAAQTSAAENPDVEKAALPVKGTVALKYKTYRTWKFRLPAEAFTAVGSGFALPHAGGKTFAAKLEGTALAVDTNGDGKFDAKVERDKDAQVATGLVKLQGKSIDGKPFTYAARVVEAGKGWAFAASGAMNGKIGETKIRVIDQNNNGRYNDYGVDAVIVGRGQFACFLSHAVNVAGKLYSFEITPDGSSLTYKPFEGKTGTLDLATSAKIKAKVRSIVLRSTDGRYSFDAAKAGGGFAVPAGAYTLHSGELVLGDNTLKIRGGESKPLNVVADKKLEHVWGGPVRAEFAYQREGDQIGFDPAAIWYFGKGGEEYYDWAPLGNSPTFVISDLNSGEEILQVKFPGST